MWEDKARVRSHGVTVSVVRDGDDPAATAAAAPSRAGQDEDEDEDEDMPTAAKGPSLTQQPLTSYGYQVTPKRRGSNAREDGTDAGTDLSPPTTATTGTPCPPGPAKRKRNVFEEEADDSFGELDSDTEREMAALADTAGSIVNNNDSKNKNNSNPSQQKLEANPETPAAARNTIETTGGLPTPLTARKLFPEASSSSSSRYDGNKRQKTVSFEDHPFSETTPSKHSLASSATVQTSTLTPSPPPSSPQTMSNSPGSAGDSFSGASGSDLKEEVMSLLAPYRLDPVVLRSVQNALDSAARRNRGLVMGRDAARATARDKDARIAKLQEKVAALENKERMQSKQLTNLKAGLMKVYQDH